jgi:hypothetical protein
MQNLKIVVLGVLALLAILASLLKKNLEDRLSDPTRLPGRWRYGYPQASRLRLLPWPW